MVTLMMTVTALTGCIDAPEGEKKDPVNWERPEYVTLEHFAFNGSTQAMDLVVHLWDAEDEATEWDGVLTVIILDDNLDEVYNSTWPVETKDYRTEVSGSSKIRIYDTFLEVSVPVGELDGADPNDLPHPEWSWDAVARFAFENEVLESLPQWLPPFGIYVKDVQVDTQYSELDVEVRLDVLDYMMTTKSSGLLTLVMTDGIGMEMYNHTQWVDARDFDVTGRVGTDVIIEWDVDASLATSIPLEEIQPSFATTTSTPDTGKLNVMFNTSGYTIDQESRYDWPPFYPVDLPVDLLTQRKSTPPRAAVTCPGYCAKGDLVVFDASVSTDPDGDIIMYRWDMDDPTPVVETPDPVLSREMNWVGVHDIVLTVVDRGGNENSTVVRLSVGEPIVLTFLEVGIVTEPGDRYNYTYVRLTLENMADTAKRRPGAPEFQMRDDRNAIYSKHEMEGEIPVEFEARQLVEIVVYYVKYAGELIVPTTPRAIMPWDVYPPVWLDVPDDL